MAFLMLSAGILTDLASAMTVRRRGLLPGSPPPFRAATVSSLMMRVNTFPRLASAAPFLCLIVCHLEWPDMGKLHLTRVGILALSVSSYQFKVEVALQLVNRRVS